MNRLRGRILTPQGWFAGTVSFEDRIVAIEPCADDPDLPRIIPGFIDLHVHGGNGADVMEGVAAIRTMSRWHGRHGTCSLLATTISSSHSELQRCLADIGEVSSQRKALGARVLGCHLEGPYINEEKKGAHPAKAVRHVHAEDLYQLSNSPFLKIITLAPETLGDAAIIQHFNERGIRVQIGHSMATYEQTLDAMSQGISGFTHLYNAMTGLHHRTPGVVGAAFAKAEYAEIIPDLFHVHEGALLAAFRSIPKIFCVTDASAASGMPEGTYALGEQSISKCPNGVFLEDGTIAGSTLTMDQAFLNLLKIGMPVDEAVRRLSTYPADYLGLKDRGRIELGAIADLLVLRADHSIEKVYIEGDELELSDD
jgi:N-acetylglucosamine-6-phosphate deacetylase